MIFEQLLERFRALGGVAENLRLGNGRFGRGLFARDPTQPVRLTVPRSLLIPTAAVAVDERELTVDPNATGEAERDFYLTYQREFGWGACGFEESWNAQRAWSELPLPIAAFIRTMGVPEQGEGRFDPPTVERAFKVFSTSRDFAFENISRLPPVIELANHSATGTAFIMDDRGVSIEGMFEDEVLVRYNLRDAWGMAVVYGFSAPALFAHSLSITVGLRNGMKLAIARDISRNRVTENLRLPAVKPANGEIELAFLTLSDRTAGDLPRSICRRLLAEVLDETQANEAFEGILRYNRMQFEALIRLLDAHDSALIPTLRSAASHQLEALS